MGLIKYSASQFLFDNPAYKKECLIDYDFKPCLDFVNESARKRAIFIYTTSSWRQVGKPVAGAVVKPAKKGCHFVGHAIDFNLFFKGKMYTSKDLDKDNLDNLPKEIKDFLLECENHPVIRWGGYFRVEDDIHMDSGLNLSDPKKYDEKYKQYQAT